MTKSTKARTRRKDSRPEKPYADYPLSAHPGGKWQKKIRGKIHYFGRWGRLANGRLERVEGDGWREALEEYRKVADDLHAGRTPRERTDGTTVADISNHFLTAKRRQVESGELAPRSFTEYRKTTDLLVKRFGGTRLVDDLAASDFGALRAVFAKRFGPARLGNEIQRVRTVFKFAFDAGLIDRPARFGPEFAKPSRSVMRKHRAKAGPKLFEREGLRTMIDGAMMPGDDEGPELVRPSAQLKAMILLGINCGFGPADCAALPLAALDLDAGFASYPRPKTGISRRCAMWPETVEALRKAIAGRRGSPETAGLVFVTKYGQAWMRDGKAEAVSHEFGKLLKSLGLSRKGIGIYALRHTYRTVADATRDYPAVRMTMGHADASIDDVYRERIEDDRLRAVADYVRNWLYGGNHEAK